MGSGAKRKDVRSTTTVLLDGKGGDHVEDVPAEKHGAIPHPHRHAQAVMGCCAHEIPEYYRQRYILSGYRAPPGDLVACAKTLFAIHNETVNIWSHLLSALAALVMYCVTLRTLIHDGASLDRIAAFTLFFLCAGACFVCSSVYHLFNCCSFQIYRKVMTLDYLGIFFHIMGAFIGGLHFAFFCFPFYRTAYQIGISSLCVTGIVMAVSPKFDSPQFRMWRIAVYVLVVSFAVLPLIHGLFLVGVYDTLPWWGMLCTFGIGTIFYATRWPESRYPGRFDIWCSSHQLWHLFVCLGTLYTYFNLCRFYVRTIHGCEGHVETYYPDLHAYF